MNRLEPEFRVRLVDLAASQAFSKTESKMRGLTIRRRTDEGALQEIWLTPQSVFSADGQPLDFAVSVWTYVTFPELESIISEAVQLAGSDPQITDRRSASFPLSKLVVPGDATCLQGLILDHGSSNLANAEAVWSFYWERASTHLRALSSANVLSDFRYMPPFTSNIAWGTSQLLHHYILGRTETCNSIVRGIEKTAPTELLAPIRAMMTGALQKGHEFTPSSRALDYRTDPRWLEFEAVRTFVSRAL